MLIEIVQLSGSILIFLNIKIPGCGCCSTRGQITSVDAPGPSSFGAALLLYDLWLQQEGLAVRMIKLNPIWHLLALVA